MPMLRSCLGATSRWLGRHLGRLNRVLSSLGDRLREAVSEAVGASVDGAVREAVHGLLDGPASPPPLRPPRRGPPSAQAPLWDRPVEYRGPPERPYGEPWQDHPSEGSYRDWEEGDAGDEPEPEPPRPSRWPAALAAGLQAAAWWLRRAARPTLLAAAGAGLLAALTAWAWGPLALAGLAGSALALAALPHDPDDAWRGVERSLR
jgi:hypothetical protein